MTATAIARETGETIIDARKHIWLRDSQVSGLSCSSDTIHVTQSVRAGDDKVLDRASR